jgi:hypothetical protein
MCKSGSIDGYKPFCISCWSKDAENDPKSKKAL